MLRYLAFVLMNFDIGKIILLYFAEEKFMGKLQYLRR